MYVRNVIALLGNQKKVLAIQNFTFTWGGSRTRKGRPVFITLSKQSFQNVVEELRSGVKSNANMDVMRMSKENCDREKFVEFVQLYSDKFVTSPKQTSVTAYPVQTNLMNVSYDEWKNGFWTGEHYLPVCMLILNTEKMFGEYLRLVIWTYYLLVQWRWNYCRKHWRTFQVLFMMIPMLNLSVWIRKERSCSVI